MTIGERIKSFRSLKQLTQKALAERSGVSEIAIKKYESGERTPKPAQLKKIAQALNLSESIFKIKTTELETVGDAMALFLLLYKKVGILPTYDHDKNGDIDPNTLKLHFTNKRMNAHIAEFLINYRKESFTLDFINQQYQKGNITREEYDQQFHMTKGIYELIEQEYMEDKSLLDD
ncbi:MAG TPA: helix-turn-helix transcriptional regulator [Caproicibacter sp.]|nr:helix-turn-helix transcriptional regulator [Caproicibacter sp.]